MNKEQKLEMLLDIYANEWSKLDELPPVKDEETQKDVDEQYGKLMKVKKKIIDLALNK